MFAGVELFGRRRGISAVALVAGGRESLCANECACDDACYLCWRQVSAAEAEEAISEKRDRSFRSFEWNFVLVVIIIAVRCKLHTRSRFSFSFTFRRYKECRYNETTVQRATFVICHQLNNLSANWSREGPNTQTQLN